MTSFVHIEYPTTHPGVARFESAVAAAGKLRKSFDGTKGLAGALLAAMVAALMVVADQLVDTWADGHLLAAWVLLWVVAFGALALLAPTTRYFSGNLIRGLDAWSRRMARERADERLWEVAQRDSRVMADLLAAKTRAEAEAAELVVTEPATKFSWSWNSSEAQYMW
jgi:hypothetical protein